MSVGGLSSFAFQRGALSNILLPFQDPFASANSIQYQSVLSQYSPQFFGGEGGSLNQGKSGISPLDSFFFQQSPSPFTQFKSSSSLLDNFFFNSQPQFSSNNYQPGLQQFPFSNRTPLLRPFSSPQHFGRATVQSQANYAYPNTSFTGSGFTANQLDSLFGNQFNSFFGSANQAVPTINLQSQLFGFGSGFASFFN